VVSKLRMLDNAIKRERIEKLMPKLVDMLHKHPDAHNVRFDTRNGSVAFKYRGRKVQYFVGAQKLIVRNAQCTTVHEEFDAACFVVELKLNDPKRSFQIKEDEDGQLSDPRT